LGKVRGFLEIKRSKNEQRPVDERLHDWQEFELPVPESALREQAARCMDCGIPFCHDGCPLGNLIPDWNDLTMNGRLGEASAALHATNNFPEFTGRVCPAPCEASCVLNINNEPVTIKNVERHIADRSWEEGLVVPKPASFETGRKIAVIGSGPAGLAAAQELARHGHDVTVFEKADRVGGLLRYGIPDFKMEKHLIDRRVEQMQAEGVKFRTSVNAGVDVTGEDLKKQFDAIVLAGGAEKPRDLPVPGRELGGVHFAMEFLVQQNHRVAGDHVPTADAITATDKHVVVLGGGDTGSDCIGTSHRQGAVSVTSLELMPRPPDVRGAKNPWPEWPLVMRSSSSHEEGGARDFGVMTTRVIGENGRVKALEAVRIEMKNGAPTPIAGTEFQIPCDLLLLAMGFVAPVTTSIVAQLGLPLDGRGNVATERSYSGRFGATSVPGVFAAGDMARGQSLVGWASAEGRRVARTVDTYLASLAAPRAQAAAGA
jgi:glutamate synthase (NADPH/NADH) small chain